MNRYEILLGKKPKKIEKEYYISQSINKELIIGPRNSGKTNYLLNHIHLNCDFFLLFCHPDQKRDIERLLGNKKYKGIIANNKKLLDINSNLRGTLIKNLYIDNINILNFEKCFYPCLYSDLKNIICTCDLNEYLQYCSFMQVKNEENFFEKTGWLRQQIASGKL